MPPNGLFTQISGTVGAAKTAARHGVPAISVSQGFGDPIDYAAGVAEAISWLDKNRKALLSGVISPETVSNLNIPTCNQGTIRNPLAPLEVPLATDNPNDFLILGTQNCELGGIEPDTDFNAFFTGWVTLSEIPAS